MESRPILSLDSVKDISIKKALGNLKFFLKGQEDERCKLAKDMGDDGNFDAVINLTVQTNLEMLIRAIEVNHLEEEVIETKKTKLLNGSDDNVKSKKKRRAS